MAQSSQSDRSTGMLCFISPTCINKPRPLHDFVYKLSPDWMISLSIQNAFRCEPIPWVKRRVFRNTGREINQGVFFFSNKLFLMTLRSARTITRLRK